MDGAPVINLARHLSTYKIPCFKGINKLFVLPVVCKN